MADEEQDEKAGASLSAVEVAKRIGKAKPASDVEVPVSDDKASRAQKIQALNEEFAFVLLGSKGLILRFRSDAPPTDRVTFLSVDAFKHFQSNKFIYKDVVIKVPQTDQYLIKPQGIPLAKYWMESRGRRTYDGIEFFPRPETVDPDDKQFGHDRPTARYFNLWQGFSVTPDTATSPHLRRQRYSVFYDHLHSNVCNGNQTHADWIFAWIAHLLQKPRERPGTAIVLRGGEGVGKTKIGEVVGSLIAAHYALVDDPRYVTGNFNAHMASCLLLQVDEGYWAGDKAGEGRIKGLLTSPAQMIERKGIDPVRLRNFVRVLFTSNEDWVVPVGLDGRRFAVFQVAEHAKQNHAYFAEMDRQLREGGREALLADLLELDLSTPSAPDIRSVPYTGALLEQKIRSLDPIDTWWFARLTEGAQTRSFHTWARSVQFSDLFSDYISASEQSGIRRKAAETEFGIRMRKLVANLKSHRSTEDVDVGGETGSVRATRKRVQVWTFPSLLECRAAFERLLGQQVDWRQFGGEEITGEAEASDG